MIVEIQLWQMITLLLSFFGCVAGFWKIIEARREKSDDRRWEDLHRHIDARFQAIAEHQKTEWAQWQQLDRKFMEFKAELPREYVRREDYIRGQSVVESKIDALALKIENILLKGALT
jgi:hypothetical protein